MNVKILTTAAIGIAALVQAGGALAAPGGWAAHHPRRVEVNARLANQNRRVAQGLADGQLTRPEARQIRREDRTIRREERFDARLDRSHITRPEQRALNQQENAVSRQIYAERH